MKLPLRLALAATVLAAPACTLANAGDGETAAASASDALASSRPTAVHAQTDVGNAIDASLLVDPPTGAGWASPAILVSYTDKKHLFGGKFVVDARVTVHFSAPTHEASVALGLEGSGGTFTAPLFVDRPDIDHVEAIDVAVTEPGHAGKTYHLGGIRPDADDAASIGPYDRVAARGISARAAEVPPGAGGSDDGQTYLDLTVDVVDATFLREEVPGYDGKGKAFALLPRTTQGKTAWERAELPFAWSQSGRSHFQQSPLLSAVDQASIEKLGVAFGLDTNMGTIWLQSPGQNQKPFLP